VALAASRRPVVTVHAGVAGLARHFEQKGIGCECCGVLLCSEEGTYGECAVCAVRSKAEQTYRGVCEKCMVVATSGSGYVGAEWVFVAVEVLVVRGRKVLR
jgi:hypothetical protein